jgi:excisionase family DNA binding protein
MTHSPQLLTLQEVADLCRVHVQTIRAAVKAGEIQVVQAPGTRGAKGRRVPYSAMIEWLNAQTPKT